MTAPVAPRVLGRAPAVVSDLGLDGPFAAETPDNQDSCRFRVTVYAVPDDDEATAPLKSLSCFSLQ